MTIHTFEVYEIKFGNRDFSQARLLQEIDLLRQCNSRSIVQFVGYSKTQTTILLLMEHMKGDLYHRLRLESNEYLWYQR